MTHSHNFKDLIGHKFGKLKVISLSKRKNKKRVFWNCKCKCGNNTIVTSGNLKNGHTKSCGCLRGDNFTYKGCGELSGLFWCHILSHAKDRKIEVNINIEDAWNLFLKQDKKCSLTGLELNLINNKLVKRTGSLDRIDSSKNYNLDNIQWIHKIVQLMKWILSDSDFIELCCMVTYPITDKERLFVISNEKGCWNSKKIGNLDGSHFAQIRQGAKCRNIEFNITQQYIWDLYVEQNGRCAFTGLPIDFRNGWKNNFKTASLDRIDNKLGYNTENVCWVHKTINMMKRNLTNKDFLYYCQLVSNYKGVV